MTEVDGLNAGYARALLDEYLENPEAVSSEWRALFESDSELLAQHPGIARLLELLRAAGPDGTNLAELGVGTNERATLTGNVLEDEKILGTAHVAFGASAAIGGTVQVPVHLDCVVMTPDVTVDGEPLVRGGELLF